MKAVRYYGPKDVRLEDIPKPEISTNEVLVRVRAAGLCGTDLEIYDGIMFYYTSGLGRIPITPGHEWAGEVVEVGSGVSRFRVGDLVSGECTVSCMQCDFCRKGWYNQCPYRTETGILNRDGGFAEYIAFPGFFLHCCNDMKAEEAAFIEPTAVALYATKLGGICPADRVAVMGPGPIGLFAVQTAKAYGARQVLLLGTREDRLKMGLRVGADAAINVRNTDLTKTVTDLTQGNMIDVVIEAVGKPKVWEEITAIMAPRARIVMTGLFAGQKCMVDFDPLVIGNISIHGALGSPDVWDAAIDLHKRGLVTAGPLITHRLPLDRFEEGVEIMRRRKDGAVKVVLEP